METWKIVKKVACIMTDNASNMIKAGQILKVCHHPCFAHIMNLVIQDAMKNKEISCIITKCKHLVSFFKSSNLATQALSMKQENKNMTPLKLMQEVPTWWNSALKIIKRII